MTWMEKIAHDFRQEADDSLAKYRKDRSEAFEAGSLGRFLHNAGESFHENITPLLHGPMTSPAGHIGSGDSPTGKLIMALSGLRGGPQASPIITMHELDEAKSHSPDSLSGQEFREFIKKQIAMRGSASPVISSHVGPYVIMNESNRILRSKDIDPKTYDVFKKIRSKEDKIFNFVLKKSESNQLKDLVPGLPGYGERQYTDAEIEAANNAIVNSKNAAKLVKGYNENKKYNPEMSKGVAEAVSIAATVLPLAVVGQSIYENIKSLRALSALRHI